MGIVRTDGDQERGKVQTGALLDLGANGIGCKCDIPHSVMSNMDLPCADLLKLPISCVSFHIRLK